MEKATFLLHFSRLACRDASVLGVAGALVGGVLTASAIMGRNLLSVITKAPRAGKAAA
jgi:hypothetical protein